MLSQVREQYPHVPVVMVTDTGSEEVAAAGMKGGLADYVLKDHLHRLPLAFKESLEKSPLAPRSRGGAGTAAAFRRALPDHFGIVVGLRLLVRNRGGRRHQAGVDHPGIHADYGIRGGRVGSGVLLPLVHPEDRALIEHGRSELLSGRPYSAEIRIVTKDGQVRWLNDVARPVWDPAEKRVVCIYGAGEDITDRKRSEEERAQLIREQAARAEAEASERRYRSLGRSDSADRVDRAAGHIRWLSAARREDTAQVP